MSATVVSPDAFVVFPAAAPVAAAAVVATVAVVVVKTRDAAAQVSQRNPFW